MKIGAIDATWDRGDVTSGGAATVTLHARSSSLHSAARLECGRTPCGARFLRDRAEARCVCYTLVDVELISTLDRDV